MASKRNAIAVAAVAALGVASVGSTNKPTDLTTHRQRKRKLGSDQLPALVVWLSRERREYDATGRVSRYLDLFVEARVAHPGTSGDEALDPLLVWAEKALMVDVTISATCTEVKAQETDWDLEDESDTLARAAIRFEVRYPTSDKDPEVFG